MPGRCWPRRGRPIRTNETSLDVEHDLAAIGASLLVATLDRLARGEVPETPQDESAASYAQRLTKDDGLVDWGRPAVACTIRFVGFIRGRTPHSFLLGSRLILLRSVASEAAPGLRPGPSWLRTETICTSPRVRGSWS